MLKASWLICSAVLLLASAGCASTSSSKPPPPPAWIMQPAPDLLTPLQGIISLSESESKPSQSN